MGLGGQALGAQAPFRCPRPRTLKPCSPAAAFHTAKCEQLQKEKEELERRCEDEVRRLGWQQRAELRELEQRLQLQFQAEGARLQDEHRAQLLRLGCQHQEQVSPRPGGPVWVPVPIPAVGGLGGPGGRWRSPLSSSR